MPLSFRLGLCVAFFLKPVIKCQVQVFLCAAVYMALVSFGRDTHAAKGCTDPCPCLLSPDRVTTDFQPSKPTWPGGVKLRLKTR